ncbi:MAG: hypothetical protein E7552_06600 [Ruminococcaceae bacterium]|nr:hypothetical protein [Oscillospiraceae bacterium]
MKNTFRAVLALLCVVTLLLGCSSALGSVSVAASKYKVSYKVFPPADGMFGEEVTLAPNAGSKIGVSYNQCGVQLPEGLEYDALALYVRVTLNEPAAAALEADGSVELGNSMDAGSAQLRWTTKGCGWKAGENEILFRFAQATGAKLDITKTLNWFRITSGTLSAKGSVTFHEVAVVDATEGGIEFGKDDTYLKITAPITATPNTIEASVRVDPAAKLTAERYAVFSNRGSGDTQPIALSMTAAGALVFQWGDTSFTVPCDVRTGEWVDIAVVRDMTDKKFYVYLDGEKNASFDATDTADILPTAAHTIAWDAESAVFKGGIADVRVWSDVRTEKEIRDSRVVKTSNRQNGLAADEQGLLGSWYLVGTANYVLAVQKDGSRFGNHATFGGSRADDWVDYTVPTDTVGEDYYTMVFIPDTQELCTGVFTEEWMAAAQWIADNVEKENIVHVIGAGDNTWTDDTAQWQRIKAGWDLFTNKVSWSNMTGNHDYPGSCTPTDNPDYTERNTKKYNLFFGKNYIQSTAAKDTYCGSFADDYNIYGVTADENGKYQGAENSYFRFGVSGVRWMILQLEYHPRVSVINWANEILAQYPDDNVIVTTHAYIGGDNGRYSTHWMPYTKSDAVMGGYIGQLMTSGSTKWPGGSEEPIWTHLIAKNDNVKMLLCGHDGTSDGHVLTRWDKNEAGNVVPQVMMNAQDLENPNGFLYFEGQALSMLGLLRFSADGTKCEIQYYSPYHDATYHPSNLEMLSLSLTAKPCDHPTTEPRDEIPATATQNGYTAGVWCTACKTYVEGGEVIPATGLLGDVDGNGAVNSTDARLTLQYAVQKIDGEGLELGAADVDGSGAVNSTDARLILQYAVQKIDKLPAA